MVSSTDIHDLVSRLKTDGEVFAIATVVRTVSLTSAKAGAKAIIRDDGTISGGWIGGGCARSAVLKAAKETMADGAPRFLSIKPEDLLDEQGVSAGETKEGVRYARTSCPSRGSMDIFVEAVHPKPELVVMGASPVAVALAGLAPALDFAPVVCAPKADHARYGDTPTFVDGFDLPSSNARRFVVVSTQGQGDETALTAALQTSADYIAFVGSFKKAASLRAKLLKNGVNSASFDRLKAPAGLDIKAITPEEIALSILAEIVNHRRTRDRETASVMEDDNATKEPAKNQSLFHQFTETGPDPIKHRPTGVKHDNAFMYRRRPCC